jgi:phosphatidylserine decarboxylase
MKQPIKSSPYIHPEGWKFAAIFFSISACVSFVWLPIAFIGYLFTFFVVWFFRDPDRNPPFDLNKIVSSADGKVCLIDEALPPDEVLTSQEKMKRICVFMNVFNVHVNRSPIKGLVETIVYKKGQFLNASLDKASDKNERSSLIIKSENGSKIIVVQIAGLIARRILNSIQPKDTLQQGERFGLIRFGSRVDIYMPLNSVTECKLWDKVTAGETVLASLENTKEDL